MIGTSLGRYRILEPLGRGGMGEIYVAEDPALARRVAVKVLPAEFQHDPDRRRRLMDEARAASGLNHPNIVVIFDVGESNGSLFLAMELIEGETVNAWARSSTRTPREVLALVRQVAVALAVAHEAGLVHRDLKPQNLMVRRDGLVKILDFGLARTTTAAADDRTVPMSGSISGTAPYMSPEQILGQQATPASDLFSLGTILYELLTGRHPFEAPSAVDIMHRILHDSPEPPSRRNGALTPDFDFVIAKLLAKDPRRRHGSARDLDVDLEMLECACGATSGEPVSPSAAEGLKAVAVLPFRNIGGDPDLRYLGMGFADAVITRLSASPDLVVRASSVVSRFQDQAVDPRIVGQEVQADLVLDASYQRAGDRLRATARLVEAPTGRSLWADKIDVRFEDIFEVQDQVANGIAEALTARLTARPPSGSRAGRKRFVPSPEAYRLFMKAQDLARGATAEAILAAIAEMEAAVALEPGYAQAWANLGGFYASMTDGGFRSEPIWYERAAAALARAMALDPDDARARHLAATLHLVHGRKREAYAELVAASQRAPQDWVILHYTAYLFRLSDMLEEAVAAELRAIELEPNLPWAYGGMVRLMCILGRLDEARSWDERAQPTRGGRYSTALILTAMGRPEEVIEGFDSGRFAEATQHLGFYRAFAYLKVGDRARADEHMARAEPMASIDMDSAGNAAAYYGHVGDFDRAFRYLDRATELGLDTLHFYENPLWFGPLHGHPRWQPFIEGVRRRVAEFRREFRWPLPAA